MVYGAGHSSAERHTKRLMKRVSWLVLVVAVACTGARGTASPAALSSSSPSIATQSPAYPPRPDVASGPLDPATHQALTTLVDSVFTVAFDTDALDAAANSGDARVAWLLADALRFYPSLEARDQLVVAFTRLTRVERPHAETVPFVWAFNLLMAWDLPAWDEYPELKRRLYTQIDDRWDVFFENDVAIDWRVVTWGGVLADDRPFGQNGRCNCIPALDDPVTTDATGGAWYDNDRVVFGVVVNGDALAMPKHQMEIHEMLNLTLGGRELGIPYCTLCGSAQAYVTDNVRGPDRVVLRTSGLLSRSNKVMYDLSTHSVFDTFTGAAVSGPLGDAGVVLEQVSVVPTTWGEWKAVHPDTRILAADGGIGRTYPSDPLRGRDDNGPIFPIGPVDPRLPVQEKVVGVVTPAGTPVAFPVAAARAALRSADEIAFEGLTARMTDGVRVYGADGEELTSHEAFWFAWSQFHPTTLVWTPFSPPERR